MINKDELITLTCDACNKSRSEVTEVVDAFLSQISKYLEKGEEVKIVGFGKFIVKQRKNKEIFNPTLGIKKFIPAHRVIEFRESKNLESKLNKDNK